MGGGRGFGGHPLPCPLLALRPLRPRFFSSLIIETSPTLTPNPDSSGCPDKQTLLVMAPRHERTESILSVRASSAPHSLFLDQTDVHDYPPTTPTHPPLCSFNPPPPNLYNGKEHIRDNVRSHS